MEPDSPTIAVHKGWISNPTRGDAENRTPFQGNTRLITSSRATQTKPARRHFEFVNSSPGDLKKDPNKLRLIKAHARRNPILRQHQKDPSSVGRLDKAADNLYPRSSAAYTDGNLSNSDGGLPYRYDITGGLLSGPSTALCTWEYPIEMQPSTHRLLERYLIHASSKLCPDHSLLRYNPLISSTWFRYAVTDAGMLHAMLYAGALYLALLEGKTETNDTIYHLNQTIAIVNKRLSNSFQSTKDSTIGAITCLALGGVRVAAAI